MHVFGGGRKPEKTHGDTGRTCKLHPERSQSEPLSLLLLFSSHIKRKGPLFTHKTNHMDLIWTDKASHGSKPADVTLEEDRVFKPADVTLEEDRVFKPADVTLEEDRVFKPAVGRDTGGGQTTHRLRLLETWSSHILDVPEYVAVLEVNGVEIVYCDSHTLRADPRQMWMDRAREHDPSFWSWASQVCVDNSAAGKHNLKKAKLHFQQDQGAHVWQRLYGCDWNEDTHEFVGHVALAFDGEEFVSPDMVPKPQVQANKWPENEEEEPESVLSSDYRLCAYRLSFFVQYGQKTVRRTGEDRHAERPLVSLLQKSSSSPVTCHATGFYPDRAVLFWTREGQQLSEDPGDILPNGDGTYQTSVDLDLSSVPAQDWDKYDCVFQLSVVQDDIITRLDRTRIRTNAERPRTSRTSRTSALTGPLVFALMVVLGLTCVASVSRCRRRTCSGDSCTKLCEGTLWRNVEKGS
ncbi:hypothetical protein WMY93_004865 [Mugilogobius chulae]|uniref:Ig-like domain-containing protein n=1 Tax=Mugilogobius chulae TaxID=88201 RepID=A0AAW0PQ69_9GOBI